jgi:hypothetical protein
MGSLVISGISTALWLYFHESVTRLLIAPVWKYYLPFVYGEQ